MKCTRRMSSCSNGLPVSSVLISAVLMSWRMISAHRYQKMAAPSDKVNAAAPGFRMHIEPAEGLPRMLPSLLLICSSPNRSDGRIIIAITGTNGKTTTTRLLHILPRAPVKLAIPPVMVCIYKTKWWWKETVRADLFAVCIKDLTVDFAVLECARGGIPEIRSAFRTAK